MLGRITDQYRISELLVRYDSAGLLVIIFSRNGLSLSRNGLSPSRNGLSITEGYKNDMIYDLFMLQFV